MKATVCIIGSGVGGSTVATDLMDAGITGVVMVECGPTIPMADQRIWRDALMSGAVPAQSYGPGGEFTYSNVLATPVFDPATYRLGDIEETGPMAFGLERRALRGRGGTTLHFDGWAYRLKPEDFELKRRTGRGVDWPISYAELEPFYAKAERTMQVTGEASDPDHPPRSGPFPLKSFEPQRTDEPFIAAMNALDWPVQRMVIARNTEPINGATVCQATGNCHYCPIGGRFTGDQPLDRLEKRPGFTLLCETTALRLVQSAKGTVRALEVFDQKSGKRYEIEADRFVIAAGAAESAKLLLASSNDWWPTGLGNSADMVGRNLFCHPILVSQPPITQPLKGNAPPEMDFTTAASRHFNSPEEQATGKFIVAYMPMGPNLAWHLLRDESHASLQAAFEEGWPVGPLLTQCEQFPNPHNRITLAPGANSRGAPRARIHFSLGDEVAATRDRQMAVHRAIFEKMGYAEISFQPMNLAAHPMGTCRMAEKAADGVVDRNLTVFGVDNVHVASSGVFPTAGPANPTLAIMALSHRLSDHLIANR